MPASPNPRAARAAPLKRARIASLRRDQRGAAATEMALVMPFALLLLAGIVEFGMLFFLQNNMVRIANDIVRRIAVGELTGTEAVTEAESRLAGWSATFTVTVDAPTANDVRMAISVPVKDAAILDIGGLLGEQDMTAEATMRVE